MSSHSQQDTYEEEKRRGGTGGGRQCDARHSPGGKWFVALGGAEVEPRIKFVDDTAVIAHCKGQSDAQLVTGCVKDASERDAPALRRMSTAA